MIIDLSNYRLKEDICDAIAAGSDSDPASAESPVVRMPDILIGGKGIGEFMAITTSNEVELNTQETPGVQHCTFELLPEELGLTSYYEMYQALLQAFETTEEELLANGRFLEFPISSVKLGDTVFNATSAWIDLAARFLEAQIVGQTFTIAFQVSFVDPNLLSVSEEGTVNEFFRVDIIR